MAINESAPKKKKKAPKKDWKQIVIIGAMILAGVSMLAPGIMTNVAGLFGGDRSDTYIPPATTASTSPTPTESEPMPATEPVFKKEGEVSFLKKDGGQLIKKIDVEVADDPQQRAFGLMFRKSMAESQGMLFLFDNSEQQGFYMKNTLIPLDIMFVDENMTILNIYENTTPKDETSLPSKGNAKYVVEVIGGFSKKHGVSPGDKISF